MLTSHLLAWCGAAMLVAACTSRARQNCTPQKWKMGSCASSPTALSSLSEPPPSQTSQFSCWQRAGLCTRWIPSLKVEEESGQIPDGKVKRSKFFLKRFTVAPTRRNSWTWWIKSLALTWNRFLLLFRCWTAMISSPSFDAPSRFLVRPIAAKCYTFASVTNHHGASLLLTGVSRSQSPPSFSSKILSHVVEISENPRQSPMNLEEWSLRKFALNMFESTTGSPVV